MFKCKDCIYHDGECDSYWGRECTEPEKQKKWKSPKWKSSTARFKKDSAPACKRFKLRVYLAGGWTQAEICHQYRVALDKTKQIKVMSQLTGVDVRTIEDILISNGEEVVRGQRRSNRRR